MNDDSISPDAPLRGVKVVEIAGLGPLPICAMMLADLGASVIRVERPGQPDLGMGVDTGRSVMHRGRPGLVIDLKSDAGRVTLTRLIAAADVLVEGMKPGAMERLGFGPADCSAVNPRLVFGRLSGWGRKGPMAAEAGHDINYAASAGLLGLIGEAGRAPLPPLALGADVPGGLLLALGVVAALRARGETGEGAVVDQSLAGAAGLSAAIFRGLEAMGRWPGGRGKNTLDGGAPYYRVYQTADQRYLAVGAIEARFYAQLVEGLGLSEGVPPRDDRANWPKIAATFAARFRTRTCAEWEETFRGTDACVTPVLDLGEAAARGVPPVAQLYGYAQSLPQPALGPLGADAPVPASLAEPPAPEAVLASWGVDLGAPGGELK